MWRKNANAFLETMKKVKSGFRPQMLEPRGDHQLRIVSDGLNESKLEGDCESWRTEESKMEKAGSTSQHSRVAVTIF